MKTREEMRFEAAAAAMSSIRVGDWTRFEDAAKWAVDMADALLAELDRTAPKPETPSPDADGWIEHRPGDPMPCDGKAMIFVKYVNGDEDLDACRGSDWDWDDNESPYDIIAWKPA